MAAFEFFGGVPARLVPDNLKTGVDPARPLRPEDQPGLRRDGRPLRLPGRPGPGVASRRTSPAWSGRCPTCVTASGGAAAGTSETHMQTAAVDVVREGGRAPPPPRPGRRRPARGVRRGRSRRRCGRCRSAASSWPVGRRPKVAPGLPHQGRRGALLGAVAADRPPRRRPRERPLPVEVFVDGRPRQDPSRGSSRAGRPTTATTRRRRSRSSCAPRSGVAAAPAKLGPHVADVVDELLATNALHHLRAAQGVIGLGRQARRRAARRRLPAGDRGRRPDLSHRARGSSPPAPNTPTSHRRRGAAARRRICTAPTACSTPTTTARRRR